MESKVNNKKAPGILLFIVSILLSLITVPFGILYTFLKFPFNYTLYKKHYLKAAIAIDQTGNVLMKHILNDVLIEKTGCSFGNEDETISSVIGKNEKRGALTLLGRIINKTLSVIDKNHSLNSIDTRFECEKIEE